MTDRVHEIASQTVEKVVQRYIEGGVDLSSNTSKNVFTNVGVDTIDHNPSATTALVISWHWYFIVSKQDCQ